MANVTYFASGTNHGGEIRGFADCGIDVGVCVPDLHGDALDAIKELAGRGVKCFVDSGAFGEIEFGPTGPVVARPISAADWDARLAVYDEVVGALGPLAYVVAPDMVAHQAETLDRLARYRDRVRGWAAAGASVLVPHQKGELTLAEFHGLVVEHLAIGSAFVAAIPMKKDATSLTELVAFVSTCRPARLHLLGLGPKSPRYAEVIAAVEAASPETAISCDSVAITALVGRTNGKGGGPRALTAANDWSATLVDDWMWVEPDAGKLETMDEMTKWVLRHTPSCWLKPTDLVRKLGLKGEAKRAVLADLDGWVEANLEHTTEDEDPGKVELAVDELWAAWAVKTSTGWRKRRAIVEVFGEAT